ncbi:MAG: hypothetical protein HKL83_00375 [Acidimicrobiaceae bacterium]|nr:hypothetical protein [Acidimicrobiaceae bacterium]
MTLAGPKKGVDRGLLGVAAMVSNASDSSLIQGGLAMETIEHYGVGSARLNCSKGQSTP